MDSATVSFVDQDTSSPAFLRIRRSDDVLALGFAIEADAISTWW
jgi:hypothetical protein